VPTQVRKAVALGFYACNLPHSLIDHPDFRTMLELLAPWMKGKLPTRKQLATTLLDAVHADVKQQVQAWLDQQVSCWRA
jgi:hypothetical protein